MESRTVFISYAREDRRHAERLYMDLRQAGVDAWLDTKRLLPGQNWRQEIGRVIKESRYFLALISRHSLNKRGFVQAEVKKALRVLEEVPTDQIFLIPVRLDGAVLFDEQLRDLNWVDLYPDYRLGISRVLTVLKDIERAPLEYPDAHRGGVRAPIRYTPYRRFSQYARDFVERLPRSASLADPDFGIYVTFATAVSGVRIPDDQRKKHGKRGQMQVVLQHQFDSLEALEDGFSVVLWFGGKPQAISVPYDAIVEITVPAAGIRVENFGLSHSP